tara:strand:+ start:3581 stop:4402 length:822 start_codon:yes stop_codon:yes gene_type:complete
MTTSVAPSVATMSSDQIYDMAVAQSESQESEESESQETESVESVETESESQESEESPAKSLSWNDAVASVPPEIATLMKKMQGDYTKKTQEVANQKRALAAEREAIIAQRDALKADAAELPDYDPFDESTIQARIDAQVKAKLAEVLGPLQAAAEAEKRAEGEASQQEAYESFISENTDLLSDPQIKSGVQDLLEANENMTLEHAYWAVKGKVLQAQIAQGQVKTSAQTNARKAAAMKTTAPRRPATAVKAAKHPSKMTLDEILAHARSISES